MNAIIDRKPTNEISKDALHPALHQLFLEELADMRSAEHQLTLALPIVAKSVQSEDLKTLIEVHLGETKGHLACIDQVAASLDEKLPKKTCHAMTGFIKEAVKVILKKRKSRLLDLALITGAQKIEHYEIASYGTLCSWAKELGYTHEHALLKSVLNQEKFADTLLTGVAKGEEPLATLIENLSLKKAGASSRISPKTWANFGKLQRPQARALAAKRYMSPR